MPLPPHWAPHAGAPLPQWRPLASRCVGWREHIALVHAASASLNACLIRWSPPDDPDLSALRVLNRLLSSTRTFTTSVARSAADDRLFGLSSVAWVASAVAS